MPAKLPVHPVVESSRDAFEAPSPLAGSSAQRAGTALPHDPDSGLTRSFAAAAVQEVVAAAERAVQGGRTRVDLRLQTFDDENVQVHLRWRDGAIEAKFVTESTGLQQALGREWEAVAPRFADKGLRFGEATFERHAEEQSGRQQSGTAFSFEQHRHPSGRLFAGREQPEFGVPAFLAAAHDGPELPEDLPAAATQLLPAGVSGTSGLRTWA